MMGGSETALADGLLGLSAILVLLFALPFSALVLALMGYTGVEWIADRWFNRHVEKRQRAWLRTPEGQRLRTEMRTARIRFARALIKAGRGQK